LQPGNLLKQVLLALSLEEKIWAYGSLLIILALAPLQIFGAS
jgi:hypothetical protein